MRIRKLWILGMGLVAASALAAGAHFISASGSLDGSGNLIVSFKEAGLGNNVQVYYTVTATATESALCYNNGGKHPKATNKGSVSAPSTGSGSYNSGNNGQVNGSITVPLPSGLSVSGFSCPGGQTLVTELTWSNITITDTTNGNSKGVSNVSGTL
jgi:hypothetical protein